MPLNKPSPRLAILRAQLAAEAMDRLCKRITYAGSARNPRVSRAAPPNADLLPLPPSYWDDLERWLKTLAPAKPAAKQPDSTAEVWHSEAPSVPGVYLTRWNGNGPTKRHWDGVAWSMSDQSACKGGSRQTDVHRKQSNTVWLRLIEADKPAQQPAQKASTHSVCIKAYDEFTVGTVLPVPCDPSRGYWLPCDESGWVTHVPTADAVCPVPEGVDYETKRRCGDIVGSDCSTSLAWQLGHEERRVPHEDDIIAWRPIAQS